MITLLLIVLLFQTAETLGPIVIPLVIFLLAGGAAYGLSLNSSRAVSLIGAIATLYAAVGPMLSTYTAMPGWLRTVLIIAGIAATALNERVTGGASTVSVQQAKANEAEGTAKPKE